MGDTTMQMLNFALAVLLSLIHGSIATVYDPDVAGPVRTLGSKNIYGAAVKGGYGTGSHSSQIGSSGDAFPLQTSNEPMATPISQQPVQTISQPSVQQPVQTSYQSVTWPSGLTLFKPAKGRLQFGSRFFSGTRPLQKPNSSSVVQSNNQQPGQASYQSVAQPADPQPAQASYQYVAQPADPQPGQASYQSVTQPADHPQASYQSVAQPADHPQASYQSVAQPADPQASYQSVAQPADPQPQGSYQSVAQPSIQRPAQASYQSVAQPSIQRPAQASYQSVAQPSDLSLFKPEKGRFQFGSNVFSGTRLLQKPSSSSVVQSSNQKPVQANYQSALQESGQTGFKPVMSHGGQLYQIGSKLYSCQPFVSQHSDQLAAQLGQTRYKPPSRLGSPSLTLRTESVVQPSYLAPVKVGQPTYESVAQPSPQVPPRSVQSTLQSVFRPAQLSEQPSYQPLVRPSRQPLAPKVQPSFLPIAKPGLSGYGSLSQPSGQPLRQLHEPLIKPGEAVYQPLLKPVQSSYRPSSKLENLRYQPQILPSRQSLSQSGYDPQAIPVQSRYKPQVQSSYKTISQPGFQTSSIPGPLSYQSVSRSSSQALDQPSSLFVSSYKSVSQSVQPGLQFNYQSVKDQNAPSPTQRQHSSRTSFRLLQQ